MVAVRKKAPEDRRELAARKQHESMTRTAPANTL